MTKKKEVSEKSLELNVCTEMLQSLRTYPPYQKATWVGLTQREERQEGLDAKIQNAPGVALMLQFKSPWVSSQVDRVYEFSINKKQHEALERLGCQDAVYYVFPLYSKWWKVDKNAPDLLQDTWLVPVSCIPSTNLIRDSTQIEVTKLTASRIKVWGDPNWEPTCNAINARDYFQMRSGSLSDVIGIQPAQLREWIDGWEITALRFTSLGVFYLPKYQVSQDSQAV